MHAEQGAGRTSGPSSEPSTQERPAAARVCSLRLRLPGGQLLRSLEDSDADELYALIAANRAYLARWLPWAAEETHEGTRRFLRSARAQLARDDGFHAGIFDPRPLGTVGFHGIDWRHRSTSLGYWLAREAQGRGIMIEAVRAMVDYALGVRELNRVEIRANVENRRSRALIERLGFTYEGVARQSFRLGGRYHDDAVYAILANEWTASSAWSLS